MRNRGTILAWLVVFGLSVFAVPAIAAEKTKINFVLDWIVGANYFYLRDKPSGSLLDLFGPWPFYIVGGLGIAALLFFLLTLPYRRRRNMPRVTSG